MTDASNSAHQRFADDDYTAFGPLKLGALIRELEKVREYDSNYGDAPEKREGRFLSFDFGGLHPHGIWSYRGYYDHLAVGYESSYERNVRYQRSGMTPENRCAPSCRVPEFLERLKNAVGGTFTGWKGGEYTMDEDTPVWVSDSGEASGTGITGIILDGEGFVVLETRYCR